MDIETVKLGLIARADFGRGLANQTYSFWKHLKPDVTVVVDIGLVTEKWPQDISRYPDAIVTQWKGYTAPFENPEAYHALKECDLIYTAETHYDERLQKHPTVLHVNPEFYRGQQAEHMWYPTVWRTSELPPGEIVPTPIDPEHLAGDIPGTSRMLHVGGHYAHGDRNGSRIVHGILGRGRHPWRVSSQDGMRLRPQALQHTEVVGYVESQWALYEDCGILVYPRRYGGQSIQVNEAMARGLAVVMTDCSPNPDTWPIIPVAARKSASVRTPGGIIRSWQTNPSSLSAKLDELQDNPELVQQYQKQSLKWAHANSWTVWKPKIEALLAG